jgi:hypothetical protein
MPTEDWIQESLARLESLEEERNRHEAALETATDPATLRMNAQAIERLDAKIRSLYAELEAAAEQGDGGGDEPEDEDDGNGQDEELSETGEGTTRLFRRDDIAAQAAAVHAVAAAPVAAAPVAAAPAPVAKPAPVAAAPKPAPAPATAVASPTANPFGGAPAAVAPAAPFSTGPASPFGEVAAPFPSSEQASFSTSASSYDGGNSSSYDDDSGGGSKMGLIIAGVVLVLGIGGYFAFKGKPEEPAPAAPTGPATVIRAGEVPPDTQGPKTVKGSDVDAIKGTQYKEGRPVPSGGGGGSNSSPSTPTEKPKKKDPRAKIESTDDPLAGIDK